MKGRCVALCVVSFAAAANELAIQVRLSAMRTLRVVSRAAMLTPTLLLVFAVVTTVEPVKLAAPTLSASGIDPAKAAFFSEYLAQQLSAQGVRVTTANEISALVGLERQKQMLACDTAATNCLAELAGALGVDGVVTGSLAKTESGGYVAALKVVNARDGAPLALASTRAKNEDALIDWFVEVAPRLAKDLTKSLRGETVAPPPAVAATSTETKQQDGGSALRFVPFAVGGALIAGGAAFYLSAKNTERGLRAGSPNITSEPELNDTVAAGRTQQTIAFAMGGAGVAALIAGGVLLALNDNSPTPIAVHMGPGGVGLAFTGTFP